MAGKGKVVDIANHAAHRIYQDLIGRKGIGNILTELPLPEKREIFERFEHIVRQALAMQEKKRGEKDIA